MGRFSFPPTIWQDFTFADDVMAGLSVPERASMAHVVFKRFVRRLRRLGYDPLLMWWRHWERRKSGALLGEEIPHYHCLLYVYGMHASEWLKFVWHFAEVWVKCTRTQKRKEALSVALNPASYRKLDDLQDAYRYVSKKYVSKPLDCSDEGGMGRFWGVIGKWPEVKADVLPITFKEAVRLRRFARKKIKRLNRNMRVRVSVIGLPFFLLKSKSFVLKFLENLRYADLCGFYSSCGVVQDG